MEITIKWRFIVGIDISKHTLDISLFDRQTGDRNMLQVPNTQEGFHNLVEWMEDHEVTQSQTILISEHTGRYGEHLLRWSTRTGWPHAVVKTNSIPGKYLLDLALPHTGEAPEAPSKARIDPPGTETPKCGD